MLYIFGVFNFSMDLKLGTAYWYVCGVMEGLEEVLSGGIDNTILYAHIAS
jgi:hypothetical protein